MLLVGNAGTVRFAVKRWGSVLSPPTRKAPMPKMTDPRDLFLHELGDLLYAENVLVKALPKLADEAS